VVKVEGERCEAKMDGAVGVDVVEETEEDGQGGANVARLETAIYPRHSTLSDLNR
jgi:hypothetical protein